VSRWSKWSWLTRTECIGGSWLGWQAGYRYRFGPANWTGEHLIEKIGSIMRLAWVPIAMTAVEWPIQV
jgi:hypothetical protein